MNEPDRMTSLEEPSIESIQQALNQLLAEISPAFNDQCQATTGSSMDRINQCIELVKAEASLAASLIADCAPQGRPMLAQAQKTLKSLKSLQLLGFIATEKLNT